MSCAHLQHGAPAEVVGDQGLVRLGEAQLPGQAGALDGRPLGGAGAAVVAGDQHVVGVALDNARRHDADAVLADQLNRDPGGRVGAFQVIDLRGEDMPVRVEGTITLG